MDQFTISATFAIAADQLYRDWLSSEAHTLFTGGEAVIDANVDGRFTAWDGYIEGVTLELESHTRIVQSWRTLEFQEEAPNSTLDLQFEALDGGGVKLTLKHSNIPSGDGAKYRSGWEEHYFEPMRQHYGSQE